MGQVLQRVVSEVDPFVTFVLNHESFAIPIMAVREIIEYARPTTIPSAPAFVRGIHNLRGHAIPVVDLSTRFGHAPTEVSRRTCIVIVELPLDDSSEQLVGLMVDAVSDVVNIDPSQVEPPPSIRGFGRSTLVSGVARVDGRFVLLLDCTSLLDSEEMQVLATGHEPAMIADMST